MSSWLLVGLFGLTALMAGIFFGFALGIAYDIKESLLCLKTKAENLVEIGDGVMCQLEELNLKSLEDQHPEEIRVRM